MIPKKIHFLWMSETKDEAVERCLESWRHHLSDYEIVEWNKSNFPYEEFLFAREAFSKKKWAFVTDFSACGFWKSMAESIWMLT